VHLTSPILVAGTYASALWEFKVKHVGRTKLKGRNGDVVNGDPGPHRLGLPFLAWLEVLLPLPAEVTSQET
jgi:hypothetical protein